MAREIPEVVRAAAGLAATVLDEARKLPETLPGLPVRVIGKAMQHAMRIQQQYAGFVARGDELFTGLRGENEPGLATFDDDEPPVATGFRDSAFDRAGDRLLNDTVVDVELSEAEVDDAQQTLDVLAEAAPSTDEVLDELAIEALVADAPMAKKLPTAAATTAVEKPAKKAAAKKAAPAKKTAPAKAGPAKEAPAKATPAKESPAKATATPEKSAPAKEIPAKATAATASTPPATPEKQTPATATPAKETPAKATPAKATAVTANATPAAPAKATPEKTTPAKTTPAKTTATAEKATPAKATATPEKATPATETPAKATPAKATPAKATAEKPTSSAPATAPIDGYDNFSIAQLRGHLRGYAQKTVEELLGYEEANRAREPYLRMLRNRLERQRSDNA